MSTFSVVQEGPVNALALNKDNTQVVIGGRNGEFVCMFIFCIFWLYVSCQNCSAIVYEFIQLCGLRFT